MSASWSKVARRIRVPAGFVFAVLYFWLARPTSRSIVCGVVLVVLGLLLRAWASGHVRKNEQLVTSGPYAYTRNPLYLGSSILAAGFALAALNWGILIAMGLMFLFIYVPVIRGEEEFLQHKFAEFEDYARNVPLLIPRVLPFRRSEDRFSWQLYSKHREYRAALGSAVLIAFLVGKLFWKAYRH